MHYLPALRSAILIKRYKRFLADVLTPAGEIFTLHCANTGAMTGCGQPGDRIWYSTHHLSRRKYPHSWELTETASGALICVNTQRANALFKEMHQQHPLPQLRHYSQITREVRLPASGSRIDFLLEAPGEIPCYLEVKSVTLCESGHGYFPDSPTLRGQKHLQALSDLVKAGKRAILFFAVLHSDICCVSPALYIDPIYTNLLLAAIDTGVEVIACKAKFSSDIITLGEQIPFILPT